MNPEGTTVGYCRTCGKALDQSSVRRVGGIIYCEEHVPMQPNIATPGGEASPYTAATAPPTPNLSVSPGLAFLLGLIPGVGAIYNGQYAKGLIHVVIVGLMISILDAGGVNGLAPLFAMLLTGFWFYMAFEAFHTAKKRQLGQPVDEFSSLVPLRGPTGKFPAAPVVLIALGTVFLLNNLEILHLRDILRFWPVLLIALGAYMLYVRMSSGDSSPMHTEEASHERQ